MTAALGSGEMTDRPAPPGATAPAPPAATTSGPMELSRES
jgi:hypothetical protein